MNLNVRAQDILMISVMPKQRKRLLSGKMCGHRVNLMHSRVRLVWLIRKCICARLQKHKCLG